jgi:Raf kinase inhibitor-like YbhB/YbcL family protein
LQISVALKCVVLVLGATLLFACSPGERRSVADAAEAPKEATHGMTISSPAFADEQSIPAKYTCDGSDTIPPLAFASVPPAAKSLALVVDDPDAPGGTFDHWIVWNIPPSTSSVAEGQAPPGTTGRSSFGKNAYGGPCPPRGEHRYFFKLYALASTMNLPPSSGKADLEKAMKGHVIAQAQMMGRYKR